MTSNSAKKCVTSRDGDMCLENKTSQDTRCIIFSTYFLNKKHIMESMCPNILSSFIHKKLRGLSPRANYTDRAAAAGRRR